MFKTISSEVETLIIEKKSKFIANIKPVKTEEEATEYIKSIKKKYNDARHHVYVYRLEKNVERYTDDGEPAGTAGIPILEMLRKQDLTNIVVVVTRYFGGVLLGTGGLARAYTASAKESLNKVDVLENKLFLGLNITCSYTLSGKVQNRCEMLNIHIDNIKYEENVTFNIYVDINDKQKIVKDLIDLTGNNIKIQEVEEVFGLIKNNKFMRS